eukprot:6456298-Prymnesium_polylepis.1
MLLQDGLDLVLAILVGKVAVVSVPGGEDAAVLPRALLHAPRAAGSALLRHGWLSREGHVAFNESMAMAYLVMAYNAPCGGS